MRPCLELAILIIVRTARFVFISASTAPITEVETTPKYFDEWCERNCSSLDACNAHYGKSYVDLRLRLHFSIEDGPGRHLVFDNYLGDSINRQSFHTQFILDVASALMTSPCRLYIIDLSPEGTNNYWDTENVLITFRVFPVDSVAVANLTEQVQQPKSRLYDGYVTRATDPLFGLVALHWDYSLKLLYSISVVGGDDVIQIANHTGYLNQGSLHSCADMIHFDSKYCEFERYLLCDMENYLGLQPGQFTVLFIKEADRQSVYVYFRLIPDTTILLGSEYVFLDWIQSKVESLFEQISDSQSNLYSGNVTFKIDPTWGISGISKQSQKFTKYLSRPILPSSDDYYERCKAVHRCHRAWSNYNQTSSESTHSFQWFDGGEHKEIPLFLNFEDWREGVRLWEQSCRRERKDKCLPEIKLNSNQRKPLGAHWSPNEFKTVGSSDLTFGKLWNSGLVLSKKMLKQDIIDQSALIEKYKTLSVWMKNEYELGVTNDVNHRSRHEIKANITNYTDFVLKESEVLSGLNQSQCSNIPCHLIFNTSSALLSGAVNATGVIATTPDGTEVTVWAFESIDIDENVNVTLIGQRAIALISLSSVRINTVMKVIPGTLGGFPGGFSVARRPDDRLVSVCDKLVSYRGFTDICENKPCCPGDQPIGELASGIKSNNINGPGSPSSRIYLFTIQTSAPIVHEIQTLKTFADAGQTLSGGFRLQLNGYKSPFLPHDISAHALKKQIEDSLNPLKRKQSPVGVGTVDVTRDVLGTSGGYEWKITFSDTSVDFGNENCRLTVINELVSKGARISLETIQHRNVIGGNFVLRFLGNETEKISHDASASELKTILLRDISSITSIDIIRNDSTEKCLVYSCHNGPDPSGGFIWTLTIGTNIGNVSPTFPTSNHFDKEGAVEEMIALNFLTGCVNSDCPKIDIDRGHSKSHNFEIRNIWAKKPFSLAYGGAGAGHGGKGGVGFGNVSAGKAYGDDIVSNLYGGSGGGVGVNNPFELGMFKDPRGRGGSGGGAIEIVANNDIFIGPMSTISCDGEPGADSYATAGGGGSGGTILLSAGSTVQIEGTLSVNGGSGGRMQDFFRKSTDKFYGGHGGGGSGGRIALYGQSVVLSERSTLSFDGGNCSDESKARDCNGEDGTILVKSALDSKVSLDKSVGAEGTSSSIFLHPRSSRSLHNEIHSGPEYDLGTALQPNRVTFYFRVENSTNPGWDAIIELREARWSYLSSKTDIEYTAVVGIAFGYEIRHGVNYVGVPFEDEHIKRLHTTHSSLESKTWTKIDIRFDWKNHLHDLYINDTIVVEGMIFRGSSIRVISISNFFEGDGVWFDEFYIGDDTSMGFKCPLMLPNGTVDISRPIERGWKVKDVGDHNSIRPVQRHESHVSQRPLYQRKDDVFIESFDGEGENLFTSDIKFRFPDGDRVHMAGKFLAGSLLRMPRGESIDEAFMSNRIGLSLDTFFWYGEHDNADQKVVSGAVMACSTRDFMTWKYEGAMLHYNNITDMVSGSRGPFHIEKPKVLYNELTGKYVMWMIVDNAHHELGLAGIAVSDYPNGPFEFIRSFYPNGNQTRDQSLIQDDDGNAYLVRTFYQTKDYVVPQAVMQPTWESVKNKDGLINFGLSFHRAVYEPGYDDENDIFLQRWRGEDKPWKVVCINRLTGQEREVPHGQMHLNIDGEVCHSPFEYKIVLGQGNPDYENSKNGIRSRYIDPNDPDNNFWIPKSVPAIKGQTWKANIEDGLCMKKKTTDSMNDFDLTFEREHCLNMVDNPVHPTLADKRIGPATLIEQRRTKYVAISRLTDDYIDTSDVLTTYEGELFEGTDLLSIVRQFYDRKLPYGWNVNAENSKDSIFQGPTREDHFSQSKKWNKEGHQYETQYNDRFFASLACVYDGECPNNFVQSQ